MHGPLNVKWESVLNPLGGEATQTAEAIPPVSQQTTHYT